MTLTTDPDALTALLRRLGVLGVDGHAHRAEVAGEGNMNVTLRVWTDAGTVIVKQAPPFVAKYPSIAAPEARAEVEAGFFAAVADTPAVARSMPRLLANDAANHLIVVEDLGVANDCTDLYRGATLAPAELDALIAWLGALHAVPTGDLPSLLANRAMRALNHAHVFVLPFGETPVIDLDAVVPGLAALSQGIRTDPTVRSRAAALGERYLEDGGALLHGDYYPGSWLRTERGLAVIDAEFGFIGAAAFDWGVLLGHLVLARQPERSIERVLAVAPPGTVGFAGIEILRRLLGVAQLDLGASLAERGGMLERAHAWVVA